ncbi:MAG: MBL fold metallo-hydrolase [Pseudomonadota bacterium]
MSALPAHVVLQGDGVYSVDTHYLRPGLAASHLILDGGRAAFVDTGTNNSVPSLLAALEALEIARDDVDYVFLTHIHLDHAGGAGLLMQSLPNARCVVHPRGSRHMLDPAKLMAGTRAVYGAGQTAKLYGEILPIDEARLVVAADGESVNLGSRRLELFYTEGHARHHYCIHDPASFGVFTGDSFGVSYRALDTAAGEFVFPSTTPVHFDPDAAHAAVEAILGHGPRCVYLTHYSRVTDIARLAGDLHGDIDAFVGIALAARDATDRQAQIRAALGDYLSKRIEAHGYTGGRDAIAAIISADIELNAQGLDVWLSRQEAGQ